MGKVGVRMFVRCWENDPIGGNDESSKVLTRKITNLITNECFGVESEASIPTVISIIPTGIKMKKRIQKRRGNLSTIVNKKRRGNLSTIVK